MKAKLVCAAVVLSSLGCNTYYIDTGGGGDGGSSSSSTGGTGGSGGASTCADLTQNGDETDVDCGGPDCNKCADGESCADDGDCQSTHCEGGKCINGPCTPGDVLPCYNGPPSTEDVGTCHGGTRTCLPDGSSYGECTDEVLPAPEDCSTATDESCDMKVACDGEALWSLAYGDPNSDYPLGIGSDATGNVYVAGLFGGTIQFDAAHMATAVNPALPDMYLVKYDPLGGYLDHKHFQSGGSSSFWILSPRVDAQGNVYFAGSTTAAVGFGGNCQVAAPPSALEDVFVVKLDANLDCLWARSWGDATGSGRQFATGLEVDPAGDVLLHGNFVGAITFGSTTLTGDATLDGFLARLAPDGNVQWAKRYGGPGGDEYMMATFDTQGNVIASGGFKGVADLGGTPRTSAGDYDLFVHKLTGDGQTIWLETAGDETSQGGGAVVDPTNDDVLVIGTLVGPLSWKGSQPLPGNGGDPTIYAMRLSPAGDLEWGKSFPGGYDAVYSIAADSFGNMVFSGNTHGGADFGAGPLPGGAFLAKLGPQGDLIHAAGYGGGISSGIGTAVAVDPLGNALMTGVFAEQIDFGDGNPHTPTTPADPCPSGYWYCYYDAFVAKLGP